MTLNLYLYKVSLITLVKKDKKAGMLNPFPVAQLMDACMIKSMISRTGKVYHYFLNIDFLFFLIFKLYLDTCIHDVLRRKEICSVLILVPFFKLLLFLSAVVLYFYAYSNIVVNLCF